MGIYVTNEGNRDHIQLHFQAPESIPVHIVQKKVKPMKKIVLNLTQTLSLNTTIQNDPLFYVRGWIFQTYEEQVYQNLQHPVLVCEGVLGTAERIEGCPNHFDTCLMGILFPKILQYWLRVSLYKDQSSLTDENAEKRLLRLCTLGGVPHVFVSS
jgi:hypothetical protein